VGESALGDRYGEDVFHQIVTRLTSFGKHEGDLPGAPRTGNDLQMTSITIHRVADGNVAKKWTEKDVMGFLQQIGVIPRMDISGSRKKHPVR
jgi:SnoaL-like polyketide cyclase